MLPLLLPAVVGVLGAALTRLALRGRLPRLERPAARATALAAGGSALLMIVFMASPVIPMYVTEVSAFPWAAHSAVRFVLPLVLGILAVLLLGLPVRARRSRSARLARRTWTSFLSPPWMVALGIVLALVVTVTVSAGMVSERDEEGRFTLYVIELGSGSASTGFYGWHHSIAPMIALVLLLVAAAVAWAGIARPPHPVDVEQDIARRRLRSTNVARLTIGALLLHLASILRLLENAASMRLTLFEEAGAGYTATANYSDLQPFLQHGAPLLATIGLGLWVYTALTALPASAGSPRESA